MALGGWVEGDEGGKKVEVAPRMSYNAPPSSETGAHTHTPSPTDNVACRYPFMGRPQIRRVCESYQGDPNQSEKGGINQGRLPGGGGS